MICEVPFVLVLALPRFTHSFAYLGHEIPPMAGPSHLVLDLPRCRDCLFVFARADGARHAGKFAFIVAALVVAVVALARVAAGLAPPARQLLVAFYLEPVAAQAAEAVSFALPHGAG